jgi:N-carbamoylputrescine amidase
MSNHKKYKLGLIQMACDRDGKKSLKTVLRLMEDAAAKKVDAILLPELFMNDYFCQYEDPALFELAEAIPGPTTQALSDFAKKHNIVVAGSIFEKRTAGIYHNTSVILERDGTLSGIYRKMHIPHDNKFYEKYYFTPGDLGYKSFDTTAGKIGTLVCWDQWYPEAARLTALKGAEMIIYPTAIGWQPDDVEASDKPQAEMFAEQLDSWVTIQRAHAIANGVYVAAINRVGTEGGIKFWGNSFVADPYGKIIAQAGAEEETVLVAEIDTAATEEKRKYWPFMRDRRIDSYTNITKRFDDQQ